MFNQVSIVRHHIYKAKEHGADFHELCRRMDITPEVLSNGEAHLPWKPGEGKDFWTHALALTGDPCLALHMGEQPDKYNPFGILGLLAGSCRNIREAVEMICRYNDTLTSLFSYRMDISGEEGIFYFNPHPVWEETNLESARQAVDMFLSSMITAIDEASARKIWPVRVGLRYDKRFLDEYKRIIQRPVLFNQPDNYIVFSRGDLETPIIHYDESMFTAFGNLLQKKQQELKTQKGVTGQVRRLLLSNFHQQVTDIGVIASMLCMTTRTLQRKLSQENTTFRIICNEIRNELAHDLMKSGKSTKGQIASLLGYSDSSTLNKAMKVWSAAGSQA